MSKEQEKFDEAGYEKWVESVETAIANGDGIAANRIINAPENKAFALRYSHRSGFDSPQSVRDALDREWDAIVAGLVEHCLDMKRDPQAVIADTLAEASAKFSVVDREYIANLPDEAIESIGEILVAAAVEIKLRYLIADRGAIAAAFNQLHNKAGSDAPGLATAQW